MALVLITSKGIRGPEACYRLITTFLLAGALFLPAPMLFPISALPICRWPSTSAAFQCLGMGMWILIAGLPAAATKPHACSRSGLSGPHGRSGL
ncbi:MAG: hypothetical protein V8T19_03765 [Senegalimassilia anaerobia]